VSATASEVYEGLLQFQQSAKKYNSQEMLLQLDTTNYDKLGTMMKEFQPYYNLWTTYSKW